MRYVKFLGIILMVIMFYFGVSGVSLVSADDDFENHQNYYESHHDDESPYEDIAGLVGWGAVILYSVAGALFPIRRITKIVITHFPNIKGFYLIIVKKLGEYHIFIGLLVLLFSTIHGAIMYVSEWKLEIEELTGLIASLFLFFSIIVGLILSKNRKIENLRTTHLILVFITVLIGVFHIAFS